MQSFNNICSHAGMYVTMSEVLEVVKNLPNRKPSRLDSLNGESLKYVDLLLCLLLSICYTCMFNPIRSGGGGALKAPPSDFLLSRI